MENWNKLTAVDFDSYKNDLIKKRAEFEKLRNFVLANMMSEEKYATLMFVDCENRVTNRIDFPEELFTDLCDMIANAIVGIDKECTQADRIARDYRSDQVNEIINAYNQAQKIRNRKRGVSHETESF